MSKIFELSDANFSKEVLNRAVPVLVDFWAPWCGPCHKMATVIEALAEEYAGRIKFAKMNVERNPGIPGAMRIRSIPTVALFLGSDVYDVCVGVQPRDYYRAVLERALVAKVA